MTREERKNNKKILKDFRKMLSEHNLVISNIAVEYKAVPRLGGGNYLIPEPGLTVYTHQGEKEKVEK